ncbi:30S ribosomal protein S20 [Patescibacteria group bacterium]|nr:30S ribosomal protein S20 [Patescibacteria group bacterium]MBU0776757.1 30S ribosomal protein S20 [Patescibacteria group bacterium]MBU0846330.1 30S ribosomal protein S20 [Patescibacteria group bacterium]MBU0922710.1 30S ribosomal protein S20 [Patescibacteria group bacterium]MBU1066761.1 30S ribosomal protein S20 [Patescibacteria group bacterium]
MPVTKTAKRALRSSKKKALINRTLKSRLEIAVRLAKKEKSGKTVGEAISLTDRAVKRNIIHRNKAARIKSGLSKLLPKKSSKKPKKSSKK